MYQRTQDTISHLVSIPSLCFSLSPSSSIPFSPRGDIITIEPIVFAGGAARGRAAACTISSDVNLGKVATVRVFPLLVPDINTAAVVGWGGKRKLEARQMSAKKVTAVH